MPLSVEEIAGLVAELEGLAGARVEKVHQRDAHSVILTLKLPRRMSEVDDRGSAVDCQRPTEGEGAEEVEGDHSVPVDPRSGPGALAEASPARYPRDPRSPRKVFLLLSARPRFERVHLVESRDEDPPSPGEFTAGLKSRLVGARLVRVRQPGRARAVEIDLEEPRGPGNPPSHLILVAEMGGNTSNLVLLAGSRRLVVSLAPVRRGGELMAPGDRYAPGPPPPHPGAMAGVAASPWRYLPGAEGVGEETPLSKLFPLNLALGRSSERAEAHEVLEERRESLRKRIAAARKKRETLRSRLEGDLAGAREGEAGLRLGELLKGEIPRIKKGMSSVEVVDWYSPTQEKISIPLDPARSPRENIERCFQRHRKAQRAVPFITARLARVEEEIQLLADLERAAREAGEAPALAEVGERARPFLPRPPAAAGPKKEAGQPPPPSGPLRFVSSDGLEILVGRSARENDQLTFRIARGNDVFLHLSGRPGAHVVVRTAEGRPPPLATLLDAAQLALYYSLPVRSRGEIARGAAGDVDYVEVKHLRKPRGGKPGQVLLARHRTLRVALEEERLARLRSSAAGQGPAEGAAKPD